MAITDQSLYALGTHANDVLPNKLIRLRITNSNFRHPMKEFDLRPVESARSNRLQKVIMFKLMQQVIVKKSFMNKYVSNCKASFKT